MCMHAGPKSIPETPAIAYIHYMPFCENDKNNKNKAVYI